MNVHTLFGLSALMSSLAFGAVTKIYLWPLLRVLHCDEALLALVLPHAFRFIGHTGAT
jgi:hypothetical protein